MLKTGGKVVYFGPTGEQSKDLIDYLESHGADRIDLNDNPANWMLREITSSANVQDLAEVYANSGEHELLKKRLNDVKENPVPALEISYSEEYAAPKEMRQKLMNKRLQTIYWRSPAYNLSRLLVCIVIAFILGSVFITDRNKQVFTESDMRAWFSVTFLSFIIIGILSITSVLPVMLAIRDVFYRHRAAGMIDNISLGWALGTAEKWFIVIASFLFCLVYIGTVGWNGAFLSRAIRFWVSAHRLVCFRLKEISLTEFAVFFTGNIYLQSGNLFLFWTSIYVPRQQYAYRTNLGQCVYWSQQLLFRIDCSTTILDRIL